MIEILDNILRIQNFIFGISVAITFGYTLLFNLKLFNDYSYEEKSENFIKLVSNKWFYIPFSILIMILTTIFVVQHIYEKEVYAEFVSKTNAKPFHHQINFREFEIKKISKNSRIYTDKALIISLDKNYKIELKRNTEDTLSYYVFIPKYFEASYNSIVYLTKKPLQ